jgi:hypothetical protein
MREARNNNPSIAEAERRSEKTLRDRHPFLSRFVDWTNLGGSGRAGGAIVGGGAAFATAVFVGGALIFLVGGPVALLGAGTFVLGGAALAGIGGAGYGAAQGGGGKDLLEGAAGAANEVPYNHGIIGGLMAFFGWWGAQPPKVRPPRIDWPPPKPPPNPPRPPAPAPVNPGIPQYCNPASIDLQEELQL